MTTNASDVTAGTNATATHYNNLRKDLLNGTSNPVTDTDGATVTFNLDNGKVHQVTLAGNRTLAISNEKVGQTFIIKLIQDGTGSRTVTWFTTINWAGDVAPVLTTTASKWDVFGFLCTATDTYDGFIIGQNLG